uniref:MFS transporter n=1 Tax=Cellulosimicrobium cellulans TaxID=1710 RepID=UPI001112FB81
AGRPSALRRALGRPALRRALLTRALVVGGTHMITAYQLYVLVEWTGLSVEGAGRVSGVLVVVHLVAFTGAAVVGGRWSDAVGRRRPFLVAAPLVLAGAALLPLLLPAAPAVVGYAVLAGVATGTFFTVQLADTVDRLPSLDDAGHDLGLLGTATTLPQAFSPLLGYAAYEVLGGYGGVFGLVAVLAVLAALVPAARTSAVPGRG